MKDKIKEKTTKNKIVCPCCGREYLPVEIFIPNEVFGKPNSIVRDNGGNILEYEGKHPDLKEEYVCDNCNKPFSISIEQTFITNYLEVKDFDSDYTTSFQSKIYLKEE